MCLKRKKKVSICRRCTSGGIIIQKRYMLYPYSLYQLLPLAASIVFDSNMIDSKSQLASTYGVGNYKYTTLYQAIPAAFIYFF